MTTAVHPAPSPGAVDPGLRCGVCDHALADHDRVGLRYCHATQAQALSRGCICAISN